jgi:hypothetical protein
VADAVLWASAAVATIAFGAAFVASDLVGAARRASAAAQAGVKALSDPSLDDAAKERHARAASIRLFGAFATIALRSAVVFAAPLAVLWGLDAVGLAPLDEMLDFLVRWEVLLAATALGLGVWFALARWR